MDLKYWCFVHEPLSYHFCLMVRCSIMLEKAFILTKLFLEGWEKLLPEDVLVPFFIHGCVLRQNCVSPLPWLRSNPTHEWSQDALLLAAHLAFSGQAFFRMPQTIGKGIHQRKLLYPSPQQSNPCTFFRISVCPWCFSWLLCCPSWHQAILQKSSPHCACRCTHTDYIWQHSHS